MYAPYQIAQQQAQQQQQQQQSSDWWRGQRHPTPQQQMEMEAFRQMLAGQPMQQPMSPPMMPVQYRPASYAANIAPFLQMLRPHKTSAEQEASAYGNLGVPQMRPNPSHRQMLSALRMMRFGR